MEFNLRENVHYKFYNANPKGKFAGDCVIRALATAYNIPYKQVLDDFKDFNMHPELDGKDNYKLRYNIANIIAHYGYTEYYDVNTFPKDINERVRDICIHYPKGTWIVGCPTHVVCVKNGVLYDTADTSNMKAEEIWRVDKEINEENELEKRANYHKKRSKGRGWFTSFMPDPKGGIDHFNHINGNDSTSASTADAGSCDAGGGVGESLNEELHKFLAQVYKNLNDDEPIEEYRFASQEEAEEYAKDKALANSAELYRIFDTQNGMTLVKEVNPQEEKIDESIVVEDLGEGRNEIFKLIKELNPNAKEANYIDRDANQMLAILNKLRNKKSPEQNVKNFRMGFTGVKRDSSDGQLYHYQDGEKGELATEEENDWED